jgi:hypothetical protein
LLKLIVSCFLATMIPCISFALEPLPRNIFPLSGEVTLRLTPSFEARCTKKKYERKAGQIFGVRSEQVTTKRVFEKSSSQLQMSVHEAWGADYMQMTVDLSADGSAFMGTPMDFQTSLQGDKSIVEAMFGRMFPGRPWGIGTPLRQGTVLTITDMCKMGPNGRIQKSSGGFAVIGTSDIRGRQSIVLNGEGSLTCDWDGLLLDFRFKGWTTMDLQSGLENGGSLDMSVQNNREPGTATNSEDAECIVSGALANASRLPQQLPSGRPNTVEQRLLELKSLLDKGLISKEQYEQKSNEVLKSF